MLTAAGLADDVVVPTAAAEVALAETAEEAEPLPEDVTVVIAVWGPVVGPLATFSKSETRLTHSFMNLL